MAWKVERWLADVFPGKENIYSEYRDLRPRELAIVTSAILDCALVELLAHRLRHEGGEIESFLGLNGDGRAPAASFGARIQLGLLLGILTTQDAAILRSIKGLRNEFAHSVNVGFLSPPILKRTTMLLSLWMERTDDLTQTDGFSGSPESLNIIGKHLPSVPEAGEGLLLAILAVYQAYFHLMHSRVKRINSAIDQFADG